MGVLADRYGISGAPITPQMFGSAGREHMEKYGGHDHHKTTIWCAFSSVYCPVKVRFLAWTVDLVHVSVP